MNTFSYYFFDLKPKKFYITKLLVDIFLYRFTTLLFLRANNTKRRGYNFLSRYFLEGMQCSYSYICKEDN
jgi:hypothetical protein